MKTKQELLNELEAGLASGVIDEDDLQAYVGIKSAGVAKSKDRDTIKNKLSAVEIIFYVAGFILYATVMSVIMQTSSSEEIFIRIFLSLGVGLGLWSFSYLLKTRSDDLTKMRSDLINSVLFTGSLLVTTGGVILMNEFIVTDYNFNSDLLLQYAIVFALVGCGHVLFDLLMKRNIVLLLGILIAVAAVPFFGFWLLQDSDLGISAVALTFIATAVITMLVTRFFGNMYPKREISKSFDNMSLFIAMASMYVAANGTNDNPFWYVILIIMIIGMYYFSIVLKSKSLLGIASCFLVVTIITIAFRYFSGFGITYCLMISTIALVGIAALASKINKQIAE